VLVPLYDGNSGPGGPLPGESARPARLEFGDALKFLRRRAGLSIAALAAAARLSPSVIGNLETGRRRPTVELAHACDQAAHLLRTMAGLVDRR
jgi:DNA-binding XRE family transcriptional regulator